MAESTKPSLFKLSQALVTKLAETEHQNEIKSTEAYLNLRGLIVSMPAWNQAEDFFHACREQTQIILEHDKKLQDLLKRVDSISRVDSKLGQESLLPLKINILTAPTTTEQEPISGSLSKSSTFETSSNTEMSSRQSLSMLQKKISIDELVYFAKKSQQPWQMGKVKRILYKNKDAIMRMICKEKAEEVPVYHDRTKWQVARIQDHKESLRTTKRVIAGKDLANLMPGIIAEGCVEYNNYRYLVFFDGGSADYFKSSNVFPIVGQSFPDPWVDALKVDRSDQNLCHIDYTTNYFYQYPEQAMLQSEIGSSIKVWRGDERLPATLKSQDIDVFQIKFKDGIEEKLFRGNTRLYSRIKPSENFSLNSEVKKLHIDILQTAVLYHEAGQLAVGENDFRVHETSHNKLVVQKMPYARKSTTNTSGKENISVIAYFGKTNVKVSPPRYLSIEQQDGSNHQCSYDCLQNRDFKTELDVDDILSSFRDTSDLVVPLLLGYDRFYAHQPINAKTKYSKNAATFRVVYETPCKRYISTMSSLMQHLRAINSKLDVSFFSFEKDLKLSRKGANGPIRCRFFIEDIAFDKTTNKPLERKVISVANPFDDETLPQDYTYSSVTQPVAELRERGFNFNESFKSGCNCSESCYNRSQCDCQDVTHQAYGLSKLFKSCQYSNKRLFKSVITGIFECNEFCDCDYRCPNRVVQNGMSYRLQIVKTANRGWGVKTLDDIPKGAFISTYAAELLDDADKHGCVDIYYADLDFISINEYAKFQDDPNNDEGVGSDDEDSNSDSSKQAKRRKNLVKKTIGEPRALIRESSSESLTNSDTTGKSNEQSRNSNHNENSGVVHNESRYPKRNLERPKEDDRRGEEQEQQTFKKIHDILNSKDFTLDANLNGNVGRFFNHSCEPNSFAQNVFINTHDLRFPTVAFFALRTIHAMEEITWNYNYCLDSIPGRQIQCKCGAAACKGRIL